VASRVGSVGDVLPLNDARWRDFAHGGYSPGAPRRDHDAPFVPDVLARLYESPEDAELFSDTWPYLCSEGTTWAAAYAAIPHVLRIAASLDRGARAEHLIFIGLAAISETAESGEGFEIKSYLRADYDRAKREALPLIFETIQVATDEATTRYLLAAIAGLLGYPRLGDDISYLDPAEDDPTRGS